MNDHPPVFDAHTDTLLKIKSTDEFLSGGESHVDGPRLEKSDISQLVMAICADAHRNPAEALEHGLDLFRQLAAGFEGCRLLLGIEGCEQLSRLTIIPQEMAVASLTWNGSTSLGGGIGTDEGLTGKGRNLASILTSGGVVLDVSHLCDRSRKDLLQMGIERTSATHCNCRKLLDHHRNLPDADLREIASLGGVTGITFVPDFLRSDGASLEDITAHIGHAVDIAGIDHVGFGSDFDGVLNLPEGVVDCTSWDVILEALADAGWNEKEIEKIAGGNWRRVFGMLPEEIVS
jgi:microsomal dipeptidase-like Zn-dependent dipeptidase